MIFFLSYLSIIFKYSQTNKDFSPHFMLLTDYRSHNFFPFVEIPSCKVYTLVLFFCKLVNSILIQSQAAGFKSSYAPVLMICFIICNS